MNIGHSSRLDYDVNYYKDRLQESTDPLLYRVDRNQMYNCNNCLSILGPRGSNLNPAISRVNQGGYAPAQDLADLESILSNRNVPLSKDRLAHVNPVNVTKFKLYNNTICNDTLNPENTRLSYPASMYRDISINRFYDLPQNPQEPIYWDASVDTRLEAKDNFNPNVPQLWPDLAGPQEELKNFRPCRTVCDANTRPHCKVCPIGKQQY